MKAILGRKLGMTQIFDAEGNVQRVTVLEAGPCVVTQVKTGEKDGYMAIQMGLGKAKNPAKPQAGHATFSEATPQVLREVRMEDSVTDVEAVEGEEPIKVGAKIDAGIFQAGDTVQVTSTSKGKGFAGTVKRHNFATGPKSHGSHNHRQPGSIGGAYPQKVFKGIKMAGRMGGERTTVKNLKVVQVEADKNLVAIKGAVPGPRKSLVMIKLIKPTERQEAASE
ncbi:MAG TPA: 50S ribosomal protein L3 [Candidatus Dormibacteraeota bacterium]|nr:50S ribosomal protein L3 [Candidatus Dormibacteraeota bacterium]